MKTNVLIIVMLIFLLQNLLEVCSRKVCGIDHLKRPKRVLVKQPDENLRTLTTSDWEPLRIYLDFSYIENNLGRINKNDLVDLRDRIMPKTQEVFQNLLKVKRIQKKLKLNAPSCETFPIPERYHASGEGVDADIVIFVLIDDTGFFKENRIEAAAIHCLQHAETRRPIAGYIQFKPELLVNNSTALDYMVWLAVHEISHILVINDALYDDYINPNTLEPLGYEKIIGRKLLPNGKKMNYIKSPKVMDKAKSHFNCDKMEGVPLEYNGGAGTAGAHWSKKYMNTDYMIGDSYGENLISDITLALFEDSGWYKVDYEMANLFLWGKGTGCDFFKNKCVEKEVSNFPNEFCTKANYPICSTSNIFRGNCKTKNFQRDLSDYERYFLNAKMGGIDSLTDKCPIPIEVKSGQNYYGGSCRVGIPNKSSLKIEQICPECACFMSNLEPVKIDARVANLTTEAVKARFLQKNHLKTKKTIADQEDEVDLDDGEIKPHTLTNEDLKAACFSYSCIRGELFVNINNQQYKCKANGITTIPGFSGGVQCPSSQNICDKRFKCKFGCTNQYSNEDAFKSFSR